MFKKTLWQDAFQAITRSLGRFVAIFLLMALSAFTLIGLKMTGPDMRQAASDFYQRHQLADTSLTSNYGLDNSDEQVLKADSDINSYELGYFQDAVLTKHQQTIRLFSKPTKLSTYALVAGKLPHKDSELALDYLLAKKYHLDQEITVKQKGQLKYRHFRIVGFVRSSEYLDKNDFGQTTVGSGSLAGYGIVAKSAFKANHYTIARVSYKQTAHLSPYSSQYADKVAFYQRRLKKRLTNNGQEKYQVLKNQLTDSQTQLAQKQAQVQQLQMVNPTQAKLLQAQLEGTQARLINQKQALTKLGLPTYTLHERDYNPGYTLFRSNSERVDILANIFPLLLFAIAALVSLTTMMRFVEEERINIGTLKALGYSNFDVSKKFLLYSLVASGSGVALGASLGFRLLPQLIFKAYTTNLTLSQTKLLFSWTYLLVTLLVALSCTTMAALVALRKTLSEKPAQLLLPKPPKKGAKILLERFKFLWKHMSFTQKVTARNLFRYKSRMFMTIFGVAGCTGLLVMGLGIRDSLRGITNIQFHDLIKYDLVLSQKDYPTHSAKQKLAAKLDGSAVSKSAAVNYQLLTKKAGADQSVQSISMIAPHSKKLSSLVTLRNQTNQQQLTLRADSVIISEKLANLLKAKVGTTISLKDTSDQVRTFKVTGITEMYTGHYLFVGKKAYQTAFKKAWTNNAYLVKLKDSGYQNVNRQARKFMETKALTTVVQNTNNRRTIDNVIAGLGNVIVILIGMATTLALVVIYNLTNINVSERVRELSTIKVLGFYDRETTLYIYRETIILSLIGIGFGYLLGAYLHHFIITSLPPANAMFEPNLKLINFLISALIPGGITLVLAFIMHYKIKAVDMLAALKSVD